MEKKGLIKKALKRTLKVVGVTILSGVVVATSFAFSNKAQNKNNNNTLPISEEDQFRMARLAQSQYLASACDVDTSEFKDWYMDYDIYQKQDEPIKYYFDESYNDKCVELTTKVLNKIYGYISELNPDYSYEIVDNASNADYVYSCGDLTDISAFGLARGRTGLTIIDFKAIKEYYRFDCFIDPGLENIITHETMHHFQFKDLYSIEINYVNSIMNQASSSIVPHEFTSQYGQTIGFGELDSYTNLSINDYACLMLATSPIVEKEELPNLAEKLQTKIEEYEQKCCSKIDEVTSDYKYQKIDADIDFRLDNFKCNKHKEEHNKNEAENESLKISVSDLKYEIEMTKENGERELVQGKVDRLDNGLIVLKNVKTHAIPYMEGYPLRQNPVNFKEIVYDIVIAKVNNDYLMFTDYNRPTYLKLTHLTKEANVSL